MAIRYIEHAMMAKGLGKTKKAVLIAISNSVNENGIGWLLISSIEKRTDLSERAIQQALAELCDTQDGAVLPILERRERAKRSSIFRIHIDRIPQHPREASDKEMTAEEMWGAGDAPLKSKGAGGAPQGCRGCTPGVQGVHPEPSMEPSIEPNPPHPSGEAPLGVDLLDGVIEMQSVDLTAHVLDEWAKLHAEHPSIPMPRGINPSRANKIRARAGEVVKMARDPSVTPRFVWGEIFVAIRNSEWLRGDGPIGRGYTKPFAVSLDKILEPAFFLQTLERASIDAEHTRRTSDPATGRSYGPAEQAGRDAIARALARQQKRAGGGDQSGAGRGA